MNSRRRVRAATVQGVAILVLIAGPAIPSRVDAQTLPKLNEPVTDLAGVIDPPSAAELDRRIRMLQSASGDAIAVLTVSTFAPYGSIEEYAVRVFEQSGAGQRGKDNGLLIVLAVTERRVRIEVGYGLEEFVPDGFAGDTIRQAMLPAFRDGQYGAGLLAGTTRIIRRIAERRNVTLTELPPEPAQRTQGGPSLLQIILAIIVLWAIISSIRNTGGAGRLRRGGWPMGPWGGVGGRYGGLGGFGGGFGGGGHRGGWGGFGGGRSGGGGASGGW